MSYWLTQSLLSSWRYWMEAGDAQADQAREAFCSSLRREKQPKTDAMLRGIRFEDAINCVVAGKTAELSDEYTEKAVRRFSRLCMGGQPQVPISGNLFVSGLDLTLYGVCDYVKAGIIYDIKRVSRYEYGKYQTSPQHPLYLHLLPKATRFDYLIFDGRFCYRETYRRGDFPPIETTVDRFIQSLREANLLDDYKTYWNMNETREELIHGL